MSNLTKYSETTDITQNDIVNPVIHRLTRSILTDSIKNQFIEIIKSRILYTVNVTSIVSFLEWDTLVTYFKHLPINANIVGGVRRSVYRTIEDYVNHPITDIYIFQNVPIIINIDIGNAIKTTKVITLSTINNQRCVKLLKNFISYLAKQDKKKRNSQKSTSFYVLSGCEYFKKFFTKPSRTFQDVFLSNTTKENIIRSTKSFLSNKNWYIKHNIPYHYGFIFYGPPGSGKTSLIYAISNHFNIVPYFVPVSAVANFIDYKFNDSDFHKELKLIVIEDIDTCPLVNRNKVCDIPEQHTKHTTSDFLNFLDGVTALDNVIWIFTTNHIDRIDPAIIRTGRIDKKVEIGYVCDEAFDNFLVHHFNKHLPNSKHVSPNITFTDVQLSVMEGKSFEDILELYTNKK